ncbi:MAG: hypothetical protein QG597_4259, partial [Actinomycetota bacterium]|nr:hypothetical protein [Actinomycetota bacterium]
PVYNRFSFFSTTPTTYGGVILTSFRDGWATKATAPAKAGCVLADIGVKDGSASRPRGITIQSTGANPVTLTATDVAGVGQQGIPVKGDIVVQGSSGGDADKFGVVLTCLFNW